MVISFFRISFILLTVFSCAAGEMRELLRNSGWEQQSGSEPDGWRFQTYQGKSNIRLVEDPALKQTVAVIASNRQGGRGYVGQEGIIQVPAGKPLIISGWYRTRNLVLGDQGKIRVNITYNGQLNDPERPVKHQALDLPPSEDWSRFESVKTFSVPIDKFFAIFLYEQATGEVFFRDLSLAVQEHSGILNPQEKYIWREAEEIVKFGTVTTWNNGTENYYSGQGGIYLKNEPFKWNFRIQDEVNADNLLPEQRTWHIWLRIYGYMDQPSASVTVNNKMLGTFHTRSNEKVVDGEYAGPGEYYWQYAGAFTAAGGNAAFQIDPDGRLLLDALLVTTDSRYVPGQYEARAVSDQDFFTDVHFTHVMASEYKIYGISQQVCTPLLFAYKGNPLKIPNDQPPAVFHVELPENLELLNISSHWAGKSWNVKERWGNQYLSWKETGTVLRDNRNYRKFEIPLFYLSNTCSLFVKAKESDFISGQNLQCYYYLEYQGEQQIPEKVPLQMLDLKPATAFKNIYIGPAGGHARSFYQEFPDLVNDMNFRGMNFINAWHISPELYPNTWVKFRDQCIAGRIILSNAYSPFYGIYEIREKKYQAVSLSGASTGHRPALAIDENSRDLQITLDHLKNQGRHGITGMVLDDENFNRQQDQFDYNPLTLEKFAAYLRNLGKAYVDPKIIVSNKRQYSELYGLWVDFKCSAMVDLYRRYQQAFLEGVREAPVSSTLGKSLFIPQILVDQTPEESKINTYWDYRKLATVCDYISPMIYAYDGIRGSARIGDLIEMYHQYIGRKVIAPTLLCEHSGFGHVDPSQKAMFTLQIYEALMQQSKIILFWYGHAVFNPINSQYISEAIRSAAPYEDIFLQGHAYEQVEAPQWLRIKALQLDNRVLLYAASYRNQQPGNAEISIPGARSVLDISSHLPLPVENHRFQIDFQQAGGKLLLITL